MPRVLTDGKNQAMRSPGVQAAAALLVLGLSACAGAAVSRQRDQATPWDAIVAAAGGVASGSGPDRAAEANEARGQVERALAPSADPGARLEALAAIARSDFPDPALFPTVAGVLEQPVDADTLVAATRALAGFRDKAAVGTVIAFARSARDLSRRIDVYEAALKTLERQTGIAGRFSAVDQWEAWFKGSSGLPPAEWSARIAANHAEASRRAEAQRRDAEARLAGVYRRLLVTLSDADRSRCMAEMIASPAPEVRSLGVDQATRAVLNAQTPGPEVAQAAIARIADPEQSVRAEMAGLLEKLEDPAIAPALREALMRETEPAPAASILRALSRHPDAGARRDIVVWLDAQEPAFTPAVEAALALDRVGGLGDAETNVRIGEVLGALPRSRHTAGSATLLARVAGPGAVAPLLTGGLADAALAAGRAMAQSGDHVDELVRAASANPALFEPAVEALSRFRRTDGGFALAESLGALKSDVRDRALTEFARTLPPFDLLAVCDRQADLSVRERYASACEAPGYFNADQPQAEARRDLAALLARARLALKNPVGASSVLELACPGPTGCVPLAPLRVTALAWSGQVAKAVGVSHSATVPIGAWLEALEASAALPHAQEIVAAVRDLYSGSLSPQDTARLEAAVRPSTP